MVNELFQGVQMNHKNNHTHTTREGYMLDEDFKIIPIVEYNEKPTFLYMLPQGIYKVLIAQEWYVFMVHDVLGPADFIKIEDQFNAVVVNNMTSKPLYLRKVNLGCELKSDGFYLQHTVNDKLDMLIIDGLTKYGDGCYTSFDNPRNIEFTSMYDIQLKDKNLNETNLVLSTKTYLKSIDEGYGGIFDRLYIESEIGRALFLFRLGRLVCSGYEPWVLREDLSTNSYNVFYYESKMIKPNSHIRCTHLKNYTYKDLIVDSKYTEGICSGPTEDSQGLFIKVNSIQFPDYEALKLELQKWFTMTQEEAEQLNLDLFEKRNKTGLFSSLAQYREAFPVISTPFTVVYELTNPEFKELAIDNYEVPTFFDAMYMLIHPFKPAPYVKATLGNLLAIMPRDGVLKSMQEQLKETNEQIIANNVIWEILGSYHEYSKQKTFDFTEDNLVGVAPLDWDTTHKLKSAILLELESGNADKYDDIIRENRIIRDIFAWALKEDKYRLEITHPAFAAFMPKDRSKPLESEEVLYQQSVESNMYDYIQASHDIWHNLTLSAAYEIRASYFYKHLRIN